MAGPRLTFRQFLKEFFAAPHEGIRGFPFERPLWQDRPPILLAKFLFSASVGFAIAGPRFRFHAAKDVEFAKHVEMENDLKKKELRNKELQNKKKFWFI